MGVRTWLGIRESTTTDLAVRASAAEAEVEILREGLADLELAMEDEGWSRLAADAETQFTRDGLGRAAVLCRVMAVANPLIKRGLGVRQAYVWGQGVQVTARATGADGEQDVNAVVQTFLDDPINERAFTGDQAHELLERALGTDGNVFLACFTSPLTGFVQVRSIPFDEITDVITNPDDRDDPWYYERRWTSRTVDSAGRVTTQMHTAYYPAITYRPMYRLPAIGGHPVLWDAPMHHVAVNGLDGWAFGIGDAYAAVSWARLYRDFLADWATLVKSLSQFAWRASAKGSKAQEMRAKLARRPTATGQPGNESSVGATATMSADVTLEAIPKTGATIDSESGRPLAAMVAAALGVPVTFLLADPGQTGARAVAETLDKPTENEMNLRRSLWGAAYRAILGHVIKAAVRAPKGPLRGTITRDPFTGRETVALAGDTDPTVEVAWEDLSELAVDVLVKAIVEAGSLEILPPLELAKLLLRALRVKDIDAILEDMVDDQGEFIDPRATAGDAAVRAFRQGKDPAALVGTAEDPEEA